MKIYLTVGCDGICNFNMEIINNDVGAEIAPGTYLRHLFRGENNNNFPVKIMQKQEINPDNKILVIYAFGGGGIRDPYLKYNSESSNEIKNIQIYLLALIPFYCLYITVIVIPSIDTLILFFQILNPSSKYLCVKSNLT